MKCAIIATVPLPAAVILALLALPPAVRAEEEADTENVFTLGEIEVSGKAEENVNVTIDKVDAEEMRDFDRNTVAEAVRLLPGVAESRMGARNEQTVFVRGFDIKHVPIFLDGIPIYVPYDGYPDLGRFTTFDLSEIIVSKGFTSVLYGPNTMGGAINMVSLRPEKIYEGSAGMGYGSGNAYNGYLNLGTNHHTWYAQSGAAYLSRDHFDLADDFKPTATEDGGHRENSYQRDEKANIKLGYTPNRDDEYAFSYIYQHGVKGTPPYAGTDQDVTVRYWKWPYWDKQSYYFTSKTDFNHTAYLKTRAYYDIFKNSLWSYDNATYTTITRPYAFKSHYDDYTDGGSLEVGTSAIPANLLKLALHYKLDVHREHNEGNPVQTFKDQMLSAGLEDTVTFSKMFYAIAGASYDTIDSLEAENLLSGRIADFPKGSTSGFNPQLGLFYLPSGASTIHASVSRKTRLPSIKDRYSYRLGTAIPNPDLDPERSINYELGYENRHLENLRVKGTVFYNDVTDYILLSTVPDPNKPGKTTTQNRNIGEVDLSGLELELSGYLLPALEIGCNYTYTYAENKTNASELTDIPRHKVVAYLKYALLEGLNALVDAEYDSKRYSSTDGDQVAQGFTVADAKLSYVFGNGVIAEAGVKNIFDRDYELQEGYPEEGRTLFANTRYSF